MKKFICCFLCCVLLCPIVSGIAAEETSLQETTIPCEATAADDFVTGEIMVGMKAAYSGVNKVWRAAHFPQLTGITEIEDLTYADTEESKAVYRGMADFHQLLKITISGSGKADVLAGVAALEQNEAILFAEPNFIFEQKQPVIQEQGIAPLANLAPVNQNRYKKYTNDPYLEQQYGIFLHNVDKVWNAFTKGSSSVVVGVIDTGIYKHTDLSANLIQGYLGATDKADTSYIYEGDHGTNVASIIGACGNNGKGMTGVCQQVSLKSLNISDLSDNLFNEEAYARTFLKASVDKIPIVVCCVGWSGTEGSNLIRLAMQSYPGLIVLASGNDAKEINASNPCYPDYYDLDNMIITGGIYSNGTITTGKNGSNYSATIVDLMAYGYDNQYCTTPENGLYGRSQEATSFAAPFVAGVAALLLSYDSTLTTAKLKQYILDGVQTSSNLTNYCSTGG